MYLGGLAFVGQHGQVRDLHDVVHHDVHAAKLGPHLDGDTEDDTLKDAWCDESLEG